MKKNTIEYERFRFDSMNQRQLHTRLWRIKDIEKVRRFLTVCEERGFDYLFRTAQSRIKNMENWQEANPPLTPILSEADREKERRRKRRLDRMASKEKELNELRERARQARAEAEAERQRRIDAEKLIKEAKIGIAPTIAGNDNYKRLVEF